MSESSSESWGDSKGLLQNEPIGSVVQAFSLYDGAG